MSVERYIYEDLKADLLMPVNAGLVLPSSEDIERYAESVKIFEEESSKLEAELEERGKELDALKADDFEQFSDVTIDIITSFRKRIKTLHHLVDVRKRAQASIDSCWKGFHQYLTVPTVAPYTFRFPELSLIDPEEHRYHALAVAEEEVPLPGGRPAAFYVMTQKLRWAVVTGYGQDAGVYSDHRFTDHPNSKDISGYFKSFEGDRKPKNLSLPVMGLFISYESSGSEMILLEEIAKDSGLRLISYQKESPLW